MGSNQQPPDLWHSTLTTVPPRLLCSLLLDIAVCPLEEQQRGCDSLVSRELLNFEVEHTGLPWNWGVDRLITVSTSCSCPHCLPAAEIPNTYEVIFHTWQLLSLKPFPSEFPLWYIDPFISSASLKPPSSLLSLLSFPSYFSFLDNHFAISHCLYAHAIYSHLFGFFCRLARIHFQNFCRERNSKTFLSVGVEVGAAEKSVCQSAYRDALKTAWCIPSYL